jgi:hypothetical protein
VEGALVTAVNVIRDHPAAGTFGAVSGPDGIDGQVVTIYDPPGCDQPHRDQLLQA